MPCPSCGYGLIPGAPVCGSCGYQLQGPVSESITAGGTGFAKGAAVLLVLFLIGGGIWLASDNIGGFFERLEDSANDGTGIGDIDVPGFGGNGGNGDNQTVRSPYGGVKDIVAAINKGGLRCTQAKVDAADAYVATGSCQAPGEFVRTHVQINIYFNPQSLAIADEIMRERVFHYVHDANWYVITQLPTAKRIQEILGGKLVRSN